MLRLQRNDQFVESLDQTLDNTPSEEWVLDYWKISKKSSMNDFQL